MAQPVPARSSASDAANQSPSAAASARFASASSLPRAAILPASSSRAAAASAAWSERWASWARAIRLSAAATASLRGFRLSRSAAAARRAALRPELPDGRAGPSVRRDPRAVENLGPVIGEIAVIGPHRAVPDEPQPVGHELDEVHVVRDQHHRAAEALERIDQRAAALDIEMVGRLVEHQQLRRPAGDQREVEPRLLAAGKRGDRHIGLLAAEAEGAEPGAHAFGRGIGHQGREVGERRLGRPQRIDLVLREIADREVARPRRRSPLRRQQVREQPREGGLAVAVGAEQRDPFVRVDPEVQVPQHGTAGLVADGNVLERHERRLEPVGLGKGEFGGALVRRDGHIGELFERLHAALRLARLGRLVAEAVDEALEPAACRVDTGLLGLRGRETLGMGLREAGVVAGIEGQPPARHVENAVRHRVEQIPVVAHHHQRPGIAFEIRLQPHGGFEIEMVRRLVEQQQVGLGEQRGGERDPHAPSAGEARERHPLHRLVDAEPGEQPRRPRRRRVGADLRQPGLDPGAARIPGGFRFLHQGGALPVGGEHRVARRIRTSRHLLIDQPHRQAARADDPALVGLQPARDETEQGRLAAPVASDEPEPAPRADLRVHAPEKEAPFDAAGNVLKGQHGRTGNRRRSRAPS